MRQIIYSLPVSHDYQLPVNTKTISESYTVLYFLYIFAAEKLFYALHEIGDSLKLMHYTSI